MSLTSGERVGPYEILAPLGAGGMGEVYRARDTRLQRDVAIKVLPEAFANDADRRARFERETQAIAALSHPNILSIFDVGVQEGTAYAVTELLEGATLRDRLNHGPLPVRKATEYAVQIARGLAAAHDKGIVHRDLKPENVFLLDDGRVKILDFGLARHMPRAVGTMATATIAAPTDPGTVLGTVGYMAPEQVRGQEVDHRTDLFSFGAVLYEMLTGRRAFHQETPVETMTAILKGDPPDFGRLAIPPSLERIVRHALEKNPVERFQTAHDVAFALEALSGSTPAAAPVATSLPYTQRVHGWVLSGAAVVGILGALAAGLAVGRRMTSSPERQPVEYETKTFEPQLITSARLMPDGESIVFSAALEGNRPELFVSRENTAAPQSLGQPATHLLSVSSKGELAVLTEAVIISHRLYSGTLARMPIDGAPRASLTNVREADWSPDGATLAIVRTAGGRDRLEYPIGKVLYESAGYLSDPRVSHDGANVAFLEHPIRFDDRGWVKVADRSGAVSTLAGEYWGLQGLAWTPRADTIVFSAATAGGQGYQPYAVSISGGETPRQVLPSISTVIVQDVGKDGRWVVIREDNRLSIRARLPDEGGEREFPWLDSALAPSLSPDRRLLLFTDLSLGAGPNYAVAYRKTSGGQVVRLGEGGAGVFSPDGNWATGLIPTPPQIVVYPLGPGDPVRLERGPIERYQEAPRWFPDGKRLVFCGNEPSRPPRCYEQAVAGGPPKPITSDGILGVRIAPDGRTLLTVDDGDHWRVTTLGATDSPRLIATAPGDTVLNWSADGRSIYVQAGVAAIPARIDKLNVASGKRTLVRELAPPDRAGLIAIVRPDVSDDGAYAYTYWKRVSKLFVVSGVETLQPAGR